MKIHRRHLNILEAMLSVPTAPYHENAVVQQVKLWSQSRGVEFRQDAAGNILLQCGRGRAKGMKRPQWIFTAHLDHPGFAVIQSRGAKVLAEFMGNVRHEYFVGARVRFFGQQNEALGTVTKIFQDKESPFLQCRITLDLPARLEEGTIGMWDLTPIMVRGQRLYSRACDDVVGAAAVMSALDDLIARAGGADKGPRVLGLLTRAEEVGFIGALGACTAGTIPRQALVVGIETSKAQPGSRLGSGAVVRVGDAVRTFDPSLTAHVSGIAAKLAKKDADFRYTRQLMPGGVCESTAYMIMGNRATALCLPLGNYHNQGPSGKIAAEQIDLGDFESLVKLLVALADDSGDVKQTDARLREHLLQLISSRGGYL